MKSFFRTLSIAGIVLSTFLFYSCDLKNDNRNRHGSSENAETRQHDKNQSSSKAALLEGCWKMILDEEIYEEEIYEETDDDTPEEYMQILVFMNNNEGGSMTFYSSSEGYIQPFTFTIDNDNLELFDSKGEKIDSFKVKSLSEKELVIYNLLTHETIKYSRIPKSYLDEKIKKVKDWESI